MQAYFNKKVQSKLYKKFGREDKVIKNHARILYKIGQERKAEGFVNELLNKNLNDRDTKKLDLSFKKTKLNSKEYIDALNTYLEENWDDADAWLELADVYEKKLNFEKTIYCYEELLLLDPKEFSVYQKLAELHFTIGKLDNLKIAKKYFCLLLNVNDMALRALWGLLHTCRVLIKLEKGNHDNDKIVGIVERKLSQIYKDNACVDF